MPGKSGQMDDWGEFKPGTALFILDLRRPIKTSRRFESANFHEWKILKIISLVLFCRFLHPGHLHMAQARSIGSYWLCIFGAVIYTIEPGFFRPNYRFKMTTVFLVVAPLVPLQFLVAI